MSVNSIPYNSAMETAELLGQTPLFKLLDETERADLQRALEHRTFAAGEKIFTLGEPGDAMYIVGTGSVELFVKDNTGTKISLTVCGRGEVFGELSLFDGGARTASAICVDESELFILDREDLIAFLHRHPDAAFDLLTTMAQRIRETDVILRRRVAKNINLEMEIRSTPVEKIADVIAAFTGSIMFLILNAVWFASWIGWNLMPGVHHFDPYPFGFLTMVVSLEAIFLSIFVLVSQNRQSERDRIRTDLDYQVNVKAHLGIIAIIERLERIEQQVTEGRL